MKPTTELPGEYQAWDTVAISNKRLMLLLTVLGLVAFFLFGSLFLIASMRISPIPAGRGSIVVSFLQILEIFFALLLITFVVLVSHELLHALFFWIFTNKWPVFGFKGFYAYAAAPEWYIPRFQFILVGLAPLVLITLCGLVLLPLVPFPGALIVVFALTSNAAGAIGDLYIVAWLLTKPAHILIRDFGTGMTIYGLPQKQEIPILP